ncbi:MAG: single-stranded-DNA-specific exonuclease RecJ [Saprospiraceae bacterium]|nr:single-stranded-DNA-specific exonuclease RecJ [Saprospiraceae bacterium]
MKQHRWLPIPTDEMAVQQLREALPVAPVFCRLLVQRGVRNYDEAHKFFRPALDHLHDPFLMRDMDRAVARLERAILQGEKILLYGDYDVDGTTSVALMYAFLSGFYHKLDYYLPDRDKEGYGVSQAGVSYAHENGCSLIIAMDCGIKAHDAVARARSLGIDFIVCDHHLPEETLPDAVANLDPKRPDCPYPYKELSGCGIAFKLAQAYSLKQDMPTDEIVHLLDLVVVSIACDVVPMTGENRTLAHFGLEKINRNPRLGLWALVSRSGKSYPLEISDLVFGLGPLINAAGRLGDAREAVRLLLSKDKNSALDHANALVLRNRQRREVDYAMADEARREFLDRPDWQLRKSIVLFNPQWHKGVIGIAASRMTEHFHRPSVILTESEGRAVGSARSVPGFDLYEALQQCEELFYSYGGHAHAAGMQMPVENVAAFTERFESLAQTRLRPEDEHPALDLSAELNFADITPKFWRTLRQFAPFGPHNMSPVFMTRNVVDAGSSRFLDNNHVRLSLRQQGHELVARGIGFGMGDAFRAVQDRPFDVAYTLHEDTWRGEQRLSLYVKAVRPC